MRRLALWAVLLAGCGGDDPAPLPTFTGTTTDPADEPCRSYPAHTVGLLHCSAEASPGYTLFAPLNSTDTYLIDLQGNLVHRWTSDFLPGESVYLLDDGHLLRTAEDNGDVPFRAGGAGGRLQEFDWEGNLVWDFAYKGADHLLHHDMTVLPDGNIVAIAWEKVDRDTAIGLGRDPDTLEDELWAVHLIEIDRATDAIVWEWHILDHVIQERDPNAPNYGSLADNPGRVDIDRRWPFGFSGTDADWNHVNGIDHHPVLDQLVLSAHNQDEVWIIDHSTTTEEAASGAGGLSGRGGELLYRWGKPENHGAPGPQQLSGQHDAEWIDEGLPGAGNLLVYNNGNAWGYSSVVELVLPLQPDGGYATEPGGGYGPDAPLWSHGEEGDFFSSFISGSQRLPNGNTLVCEGDAGRFFEVSPEGELVWEYKNPVGPVGPVEQGFEFGGGGLLNAAFRADRYLPDHPGLVGRDLSPKGTIER